MRWLRLLRSKTSLRPNGLHECFGVALVGEHGFADGEPPRILFVVTGANKIAAVTFVEQLGDCAAREDGAIVKVRDDYGQDLAGVRLAGNNPFDKDLAFTRGLLSGPPRQRGDTSEQRAAGESLRHELSPFHWDHCSRYLQP